MNSPSIPDVSFPNTLTPFRFFCQRVLPSVYGNSLSYYELLCKVTEYLNETMSNVNDLNDDMKSLYEWMQQLQNWIDEYFDNLDVQQEINQKLDEMAENGQLQTFMERLFSQFDRLLVGEKNAREQGDAELSARIANIIAHNDDTDGNSELIDIRTGFDGTTYATAGDAVRGQVERASHEIGNTADIANTSAASIKLLDGYWRTSDGKFNKGGTWKGTELIPVPEGMNYVRLNRSAYSAIAPIIYNENKGFIAAASQTGGVCKLFTASAKARYVVINIQVTDDSSFPTHVPVRFCADWHPTNINLTDFTKNNVDYDSELVSANATAGNYIADNGAVRTDAEKPAYWCSDSFEVEEGEVYKWNGLMDGTSICIFAFYDKDNVPIQTYNTNVNDRQSSYLVVVPKGAKYCRACSKNVNTPSSNDVMFKVNDYGLVASGLSKTVDFNKIPSMMADAFYPREVSQIELDFEEGSYRDPERGTVHNPMSGYTSTKILSIPNVPFLLVDGRQAYRSNIVYFYGAAKNFIGCFPNITDGQHDYQQEVVRIPNNAVYVAYSSVSDKTKVYVPTSLKANLSQWKGKKWVAFGDSLTENNIRTTLHYHDYIAEKTGITVVNMGVGGSGYKKRDGEIKAFYQRILNVPTDADVVTIFGSFNDLSAGVDLGTPSDTGTTTLCGCMGQTIDNLYSVLPTVQLGIVAPTPWGAINDTGNAGLYVDALKQICAKRGIPFLDLYHCSGLRPWDAAFKQLAYSKDEGNGVHPDETGHKIIAPHFKAFLDTLIL